uniref:Uncharacterized protein n=1 Tax=Timema tahoe TaxID=61484 RepID=A0A7R9P1P7_9NEOP|nr:unnamed protein product [Timema tahoe]
MSPYIYFGTVCPLGSKTNFNVETKVIAADFSKGQQVFNNIEIELKDIPVGILVNNVGRQYSYPMYLGEVPQQELWDILNINIGATTMMTRMLLPQMQHRKKGAIVNVSSGSELQPLPLMTVYAASKVYTFSLGTRFTANISGFEEVFVKSFSDGLRFEYQDDGITVQHLSPLFVNTKMNAFSHRLQESSIFVPNATTYAHYAVNTLGKVNTTTGYWAHGIQVKLTPKNDSPDLLLCHSEQPNFEHYFLTVIPPVWIRTYIGGLMNQSFRRDYFKTLSDKTKYDLLAE